MEHGVFKPFSPSVGKIGRYGFSEKWMHVFWSDDMPAKIGPEELLKGGCKNVASLICRNWAGIIVKGRILPAAMKLTLFAAAYGR